MHNTKISPFWTNWLLAFSVIGVFLAIDVVVIPIIRETIGSFWYELFFGAGTYQALGETEVLFQQFLFGVMGAVMAGWMLLLAVIVHIPFRRGEKWAWYAIDASVLLWFIGDCTISLVVGFHANLWINIALLVAVMLPLLMTYRQFHPRSVNVAVAGAR